MPALTRRIAVSCAVAAAFALTGCANVSGGNSDAPKPVKALPTAIAAEVKTDVGEYLVRPRPGTSKKDVQATIDQLRTMPGVQSADLRDDGRVDLQFLGGSSASQREAAVKQLAALGDIEQGI